MYLSVFKLKEYFTNRIATHLAVLLIPVVLISCSTDSSSDGIPDNDFPNVEGIEAQIGSETAYIPENVVDAGLIDSDTDNHEYTFNADALEDADIELREGEVLLIAGVALRRISSVSESGGQIMVETEYASLNEAFENADINWDKELEFTPDMLADAVIEYMGKEYRPKMNSITTSGDTTSFEIEIEQGDWTVQGRISTIGSRQVQLVLLPQYDLGNASGKFRFETTIGDMANEASIRIRDHETEAFTYKNRDLGGTAKFQFVGAGGVGPDFTYPDPSKPAALRVRVPFSVGPIPGIISVGARFVVRIQLKGNSSAHMEGSISYSGSAGFEVEGPEIKPIDDLNDPTFSETVGNAVGNLGVTVDAQYGVAYPEIALELFGNTIVPYLRPEFYMGAALTWGPLCTKLSRWFEVNAGLDLRFLGQTITGYESQLYEKSEDHYSPEGCGGSGKITGGFEDFISISNSNSDREDVQIPYIME